MKAMTVNVLWFCLLLLIAPSLTANEPKWIVNGQEAALVRVYNSTDNSKRWIKVVTRKQLNACLASYPERYRTSSSYINYCLCKLSYGQSKCNK